LLFQVTELGRNDELCGSRESECGAGKRSFVFERFGER
jgi:hypothetical protein